MKIILLSSRHTSAEVVREAKKKPFYKSTKGGVDTVKWIIKKIHMHKGI